MATSSLAAPRDAAPASRPSGSRAFLSLLVPAAVLLPLVILCMGAAITWRGVWDQARAEVVHSADASAEYARNVLDLHRMRAERVNQLLRGLSDAEIGAREAELHVALRDMLGIETPGGPIREVFRHPGLADVGCSTTWTGHYRVGGLGPFPIPTPVVQEATARVSVGEGRALLTP